jgi:hypothetical protein
MVSIHAPICMSSLNYVCSACHNVRSFHELLNPGLDLQAIRQFHDTTTEHSLELVVHFLQRLERNPLSLC